MRWRRVSAWVGAIAGAVAAAAACQGPTRERPIPPTRLAAVQPVAPAAPAAPEARARGFEARVALGDDPRDRDPDYAFTAAPGDVAGLAGEHEPVEALVLAFADDAFALLPRFVELVEGGQREARVIVLHHSEAAREALADALARAQVELLDVSFEQVPLDSSWIRDYGPVFARTRGGGRRILDARYFEARLGDDAVPTALGALWGLPVSRPPLVTEGGNLLADGAGRCVLTEQIFAHNAAWDIGELEALHEAYYGCQSLAVLPPLAGEDTGHVDMFVALPGPGQALVGQYARTDDEENAQRLDEAVERLVGAGFHVGRVPMPTNQDGRFRTYLNAAVVNGTVFVPVYADDRRYEARALALIGAAYPGRRVEPLDATELIQWSGALHCLSVTLPR